MITILALFSYSNANFAVIYLIWFTSVICFMLFFIFTLIRFSILAPVDTLNLAFGCSLSKPTLSAGWFVGRSVLICWFSVFSFLPSWVLHIAKVVYFFSPSLPNVEWPILGPLPFFFYQKSFIFRFLENCFWGPNLHNAVG